MKGRGRGGPRARRPSEASSPRRRSGARRGASRRTGRRALCGRNISLLSRVLRRAAVGRSGRRALVSEVIMQGRGGETSNDNEDHSSSSQVHVNRIRSAGSSGRRSHRGAPARGPCRPTTRAEAGGGRRRVGWRPRPRSRRPLTQSRGSRAPCLARTNRCIHYIYMYICIRMYIHIYVCL